MQNDVTGMEHDTPWLKFINDIDADDTKLATFVAGLQLTTLGIVPGSNVATFLVTPTSANLAAAVSNETGSGALVFATSPTLVTPTIGAATATSINGNTITTGTGVLTLGAGKTTTFDHTSTFTTTDAQTYTFPTTSATLARTDAANTFTGHQTIEGVTSTGATGTGAFVFATTPTLVTPVIGVATGTSLAVTGLLKTSSPTAGFGFATGAGGTVTQITSRATGVTLSKSCGTITTDTTSLAAAASATFTVTNTTVAIGDVPMVAIRSGQINAKTNARVTAVAAGSFDITVLNGDATTAETGALILNFVILKAVTS